MASRLGLGSTQAIRLVVLGCQPQTWLGQRMSRGRSPWRCLTMLRKYTSGPAYLKSEASMYPRTRDRGTVVDARLHGLLQAGEKLTVVEFMRSDVA